MNPDYSTVKLLVTGAPRSGTRFMALLMQELGIPMGHEMVPTVPEEDRSIAAWQWADFSQTFPPWMTHKRRDFRVNHTVHIVRRRPSGIRGRRGLVRRVGRSDGKRNM